MTNEPPDWSGLGAAVLARREYLRMTRSDVQAEGGPSTATLQRIEGGGGDGIKPTTKTDLEKALKLPPGWVDAVLAGDSPSVSGEGRVEVVHEGTGERILVAIVDGVIRQVITRQV